MSSLIKTQREIEIMTKGGRILSRILAETKKFAQPGITTKQLDDFISQRMIFYRVESSFRNYRHYPAYSCLSIDEEIVHGLPGKRKIKSGQILGIDIGIRHQGFCLDLAETIGIGKISPLAQRLLKITREALEAAIKILAPAVTLNKISKTIEQKITSAGYSIIKELTGHGIGRQPQEKPVIANYSKTSNGEEKLVAGMTICLEPMTSAGRGEIKLAQNNWTIRTKDNSLAAHFEKTIAITKNGHKVLTPFL